MKEIQKIKLESDSCLRVEYTETFTTGEGDTLKRTTNDIACVYRNPVHQDLKTAMENLRRHVTLLCELIDVPDLDAIPPGLINKIEVTGLSFGGSAEHAGVVVVAKRKLAYNRCLNLITPFAKWEDEHCPYRYSGQLYTDCLVVIDEVFQYMGGKFAPDPQLELELETAA